MKRKIKLKQKEVEKQNKTNQIITKENFTEEDNLIEGSLPYKHRTHINKRLLLFIYLLLLLLLFFWHKNPKRENNKTTKV